MGGRGFLTLTPNQDLHFRACLPVPSYRNPVKNGGIHQISLNWARDFVSFLLEVKGITPYLVCRYNAFKFHLQDGVASKPLHPASHLVCASIAGTSIQLAFMIPLPSHPFVLSLLAITLTGFFLLGKGIGCMNLCHFC